ncbi:MAG: hypothetical protein J6D12_09250, partial [Peptostreptococcaceae bacterium]|nr:hypothetical protein [Peptostreptococcaceae bacterium]
LVSVGEEESNKMIILSKNKNLFDGELEFGYLNIENGEIVNGTHNIRCKNFIKLNKNTQYDISKNIQGDLWVLTYDKNKNFICNNYNTIKPMDDMFFVKFYIVNSSSVDLKIANIQIEESSVATTYVEPKHYKTEILLNEPLRSIPNGVYDEIVGNKIIRRIGALTLNGTEKSWENWDEKSFVLRENYFGDAKECTTYLEKRGYSNSFTWGNADTPKTFRYYKQSTVLWSMFGKDDNSQTLDEFKKKLKENPTEVIYELAEPIMEELPNSITTQGFDDTTMYIENSITPTVSYGYNALIPYKEELSNQKKK